MIRVCHGRSVLVRGNLESSSTIHIHVQTLYLSIHVWDYGDYGPFPVRTCSAVIELGVADITQDDV